MTRSRKPRWYPIEHLDLMVGGAALFPALISAINGARSEILLETYRYVDDSAGQQVSAALQRAAQRGVSVKLITDWVGTASNEFTLALKTAGVLHGVYNPHWFGRLGFSRTHRKIAVIDGQIAFVGGINIVDDFHRGDEESLDAPRWDFAVRVEGDIAADVRLAFLLQWRRIFPRDTRAREFMHALARHDRLGPSVTLNPHGQGAMQSFIVRDNLRHRRTIEAHYLRAIGQARKEVWLANPYFVPGRRLRRALCHAAQRGVAVTLLLGRNEFWLLDRLVPSLYGSLLNAGVHIAEYGDGARVVELHAKVAVVDDQWATVGSTNCDALSFLLNHEANLIVRHHPLVAELKAHIQRAVEDDGFFVNPEKYKGRSLTQRFGNWCAYFLYRTVMRVLTVGHYV